VDDAVDAFLMAAASDSTNGQIMNLGGDKTISLRELADLLISINGKGEYIVRQFPEDRKRIDIGDYYADFKMIRASLGWEPKVRLDEALRRTLEYYRKHLDKYV
jgi:UDP-glucose 4-epimerase